MFYLVDEFMAALLKGFNGHASASDDNLIQIRKWAHDYSNFLQTFNTQRLNCEEEKPAKTHFDQSI
jgi:hypothetical protein